MAEARFTAKEVAALVTAAALGAGTFGGTVGPRLTNGVARADDDAHAAQLRVLRAICIRLSPDDAARVECTK